MYSVGIIHVAFIIPNHIGLLLFYRETKGGFCPQFSAYYSARVSTLFQSSVEWNQHLGLILYNSTSKKERTPQYLNTNLYLAPTVLLI